MKGARRTTALMLALVMMLSLTMVGYADDSAGSNSPTFTLAVAENTVKAGELGTFTVSLSNNPGCAGIVLVHKIYDSNNKDVTEKFAHTGNWLTAKGILAPMDEGMPTPIGNFTRDGENISWTHDSNVTGDGECLTMKLTPDASLFSGEYTIQLGLKPSETQPTGDPGNFSYVNAADNNKPAPIEGVVFAPYKFTLTGGADPADFYPTVSEADTSLTYTYKGTAPSPTVTVTDPKNKGTITYQWYKGDNATDTTAIESKKVANATSASLTFAEPTTWNYTTPEYYFCVVTNTYNENAYDTPSKVITVTYAKAEITGEQAISITAPAKNGTPQEKVSAGTGYGEANITWKSNGTELSSGATFGASTVYTAEVTLTADENHEFASGVTAKVEGAEVSDTKVAADGSTFTFKAAFPATLDKELTKIEVTTPPTETAYVYGDTLDTAGMVVTATYDDSSTGAITNYTVEYASGATCFKTVGDSIAVTIKAGDQSATTNVKVGKRPITVIAGNATRAYGADNPSSYDWKIDSETPLVNGDEESVLTVNLTCTADATTAVGTAEITGNGSADNYDITVTPGKLTITKAKVASATFKDGSTTLTLSKAQVEAATTLDALGLPTKVTLNYDGGKPSAEEVNVSYDKDLAALKSDAASVTDAADKEVPVTLTNDCFPTYAELGTGVTMPKVTIKITSKFVIPETDITFNDFSVTYGEAINPSANVTTGKTEYAGVQYTYTYTDKDDQAVENPTDAGTYTVTATAENASYKGTKTATLTINPKTIADVTIEAIPAQTYNGSAITPVIKVMDGSTELKLDKDYTVKYENNVNVSDTPVVTVTGKGNYDGTTTKTATFTITPKSIADNSVTVEELVDQEYTSSEIKPTVVVKDGNTTLNSGTDYTVAAATGSTNTNVGEGKVTITGTGNYTGTRDVTFNIVQASIKGATVTVATGSTYDGAAKEPAVTVELNGTKLTATTEYTVKYTNNINAGTATVTVTGTGNYKDSATQTFTIAQKDISGVTVTVDPATYEYTGAPIVPTTVKVEDTISGKTVELVKNTDYTLAYSDNTAVSTTAKVTVAGIGNYTGSKVKNFEITKKTLDNQAVNVILKIEANASAEVDLSKLLPSDHGTNTPTFTVDTASDKQPTNATASVSGTALTLTYNEGTQAPAAGNKQTATVNVTDIDHYQDFAITVTIEYTSKTVVTPVITVNNNLVYNGQPKPVTAKATVGTAPDTTDLELEYLYSGTAGTTYDPSETAPTNAGNYTVTVTVKEHDDYTGTATESFTITRGSVTVKADDKTITAGGALPKFTSTTTPAGVEVDNVEMICPDYKGTSGTFDINVTGNPVSKDGNYNVTYTKGTLTVNKQTVATPTATPTTLTFTDSVDVTLACATEGAMIYYTTDDTVPTTSSTRYTAAINLTATTTIKAIAVADDMNNSEVLSVTYTKNAPVVDTVATPTASPNGGNFTGSVDVTLACATEGVTIYYTTDGSEPTTDSTQYTVAIHLTETRVIKAIAVKAGMNNSSVLEVTFTRQSSSGGSSSSGSNTSTITNPDGSTTTTKTDSNGTVTETTKNTDGSTTVVETKKDGTVTTTDTDAEGNKTATVAKPDGSSETRVNNVDGSTSTTTVDTEGQVKAEVKLTEKSLETTDNAAVTLPMPEVSAEADRETAPTVTVNLPRGSESAKVEIPVSNASAGTVAVLVQADGTEKIIKTSVPTENGVTLTVNDGDTVKIVDNSKTFVDTRGHWGQDAIEFVAARELFQGTSATEFSPNTSMTRGMLMTVLARFEDVNTNGGATWYEKGVNWAKENGLSDGTNPNASISREQLVTILYRYATSKNVAGSVEGDLSSFKDASQVSGWAKDAMSWAVQVGIINGMGDGSLAPGGNATRSQVAAIIERYAKLFVV